MNAAADRQLHQHNEYVWLAWSTAYLTAVASNTPKRFPSLNSLMASRQRVQRPRQTLEEQRQVLHVFARLHGALKSNG